ncbi:hypothetical protein BKH31_01200 [Actinomyces oris]|uniref:Uncharacterized protein n=1 Tax=Actinomyces oris TaxID=544580 RepID=A0A1Q8VLZ4_9ACTO|nr:hypothetical protein BKH31_01200 [Actinomyces oris]
MTWDRGGDPVGIAAVVHPGWVQRALTAEDWRGFPGNEPGGGEGFSKVERIAQQIFDKLAELHITYVHEPAESVPGAQRVRAVDEVLSLGQATCLDMCATFCSAALDAGIYPLLLTVHQAERRRHALVLVPVDLRWSFGASALLDEGFSRSPLILDGDDVRDLVANAPDDAMGAWLAIDVEQATYSADRDAGDWACAIASGASYVKEWDWDVCVDVGGIRAQQDNSSELPTLARTEKVLAPGYLPLPDDSTPLQMIQTRYGVVPFCSRPEYRELKEWAVGTAKSSGRKPDVSVAVLTGAGGTGKTRMAAQLCHDLEVLGWYTGFVPAKSVMENDELAYLAELTTELLVVVDYAEESRQEQLAALLRALRGRRSPTRIVLTARGIDSWWEDFREELESDGIQLGRGLVKELEPRPDPVLLYRQAVRGFSKVINGVNPPEVAIPEHAGDTALDIVLRSWLAVVDDGGMQDPQSERSVERGSRSARASNPNARDSLYDRVLRLEFNRWRTFPELQDISLIHLRRIAATLSLLVPDVGQVDDVLSRLLEWRDEHLRRSRLAELLSTTLLRSAGDGGVSLRPDPVAEHLVLSVFGHDPDQVDAVLPGDPLDVPGVNESDASEATVTRAVMLGQQAQNLSQVITRAASQDRESAVRLAHHVLKACPHLWSSALEVALAQGGPFVGALEHLIESGAELPCAEIQSAIPLGHSTLRGVALAAMQRMEAPSERDPVKRAIYLDHLANRLSDAGRSVEALEAAQEAVGLFRELVENSPEDHVPGLAGSLNNLANILSGLGRSGEALEVSQEAAGLYRELAQASPAAYTPDLALSLNNLASNLSAVGQDQEALEVAQETVRLRRALVEVWPETYTPGLATSLGNLAMFLSAVGQEREALVVVEETVRLRWALVEVWPEVYTSDLAISLDSLATILSRLGRRNEGLVVAREAVRLFRNLVEVSPAAYTPNLALSLSNLSNSLPEVGLLPEALVVAREAVGLYRELAEASPAVHMPNLAMSLNNLGRILTEVGLVPEALGVAREAVGLYRELAEASPAVHTPHLAMSLRYLGNILKEAERRDEAVAVVREAVGLYRDLVEAYPAAHTPDLARSLSNLAGVLAEEGRVREALVVVWEAVGLYRDLVEVSPAAYTPDLARSLGNLATILSGLGRSGEALKATQEVVGLYRDLAEVTPAAYTPKLARSLRYLGYILAGLGHFGEALVAAREAVGLYRELAEASPAAHAPDLATSLSNLATILSGLGRSADALEAAWESVGLYRDLVKESPVAYIPDLAESLIKLAVFLSDAGRRGEAVEAAQEAVRLRRGLLQVSLEAYTSNLAVSLTNLAGFLQVAGQVRKALEAAQEAVDLFRDLVEIASIEYVPGLAMSLTNLAGPLSGVGQVQEALEAAREAVGLYRDLVQDSPATHTPGLAKSLNSLTNRLSEVGRGGEALEAAQEAVGLCRDLVQDSPATHTPGLAKSLSNLTNRLSEMGRGGEALEAAQEAVGLCRDLAQASPATHTPDLAASLSNLAKILSKEGQYEEALSVFTEDFDRFSPAIRSRLLLARAEWRDEGQKEDLKEAAREADQPDDPVFLGPTRRMVVRALADAGCNDAGLPAWATATIDESVRSRINDWLRCRDLKEQASHLENGWASPSKSDRDALAVEVDRYVDISAIGRLLSLVDAVMVEGVDSVVASLNNRDHAQNLAVAWCSAHSSGRGASFLRAQLRGQDEDSASGTDQPGDAEEDFRTLGDPEIRALVLEVLEASLPEEVFTEPRRALELAELSDADIAYAVLASDEDAEDALKELLEAGHWRAMLMVPGLRPGLEEKSIYGGVAASLHAAVAEQPDQACDLLRSAYRKADPGDRTLIEVLMSKASRADDCPQGITDLCAWFQKERILWEESGNGSPTSPS